MNTKFDKSGTMALHGAAPKVSIGALEIDDVATPPRALTFAKRVVDLVAALLALPVVGVCAVVLVVLNPFWNPGPLFYKQIRMGLGCRPFTAYKFRSMRCTEQITRGPDDPVEEDRITRLGSFLRRSRIDELPQFINVFLGEMSLIGPRPDYWDHAVHYVETVPGYRLRHRVRPGITGLAQVDGGYAEGIEATFNKVRLDLDYIRGMSWRMDFYVIFRTVRVVFTGSGAR